MSLEKTDRSVKRLLAKLGITAENYALFDVWDKEANSFKAYTEVLGCVRGVLRVRVTAPAVHQELLLQKNQLLKKINNHFGKHIAKDIQFITTNE